jgi:hypothetical protein
MQRRKLIFRAVLSLLGASFFVRGLAAAADPTQQALSALRDIVQKDSGWPQIHAAEALSQIGRQESSAVRVLFTTQLPTLEQSAYRLGVWRVLAETAPNDEDRNLWIDKIEGALVDTSAVDRPNALESLGKLRARLMGPVLDEARTWAESPNGPRSVLGLWSLYFAGDISALQRLDEALRSPDAATRGDAAYTLRWMQVTTPTILRDLARAADAEPVDSAAYVYLVSAAFALRANVQDLDHWKSALESFLFKGPTDDRFEAAQTLGPSLTKSDLPRLLPLLAGPASDDRTAISICILDIEGAAR